MGPSTALVGRDRQLAELEARWSAARAGRGGFVLVSGDARQAGLGGRHRSVAAEPERARQAVRARIRYVLDQIAPLHPPLHRHLRGSITTGLFCSYRPERPTRWHT